MGRTCRKIKDGKLENLLPDFDFERVIGGRLRKVAPGRPRPVVAMVVDAADFDGSFPRRAADVLLQVQAEQPDAAPRLVLVLNKVAPRTSLTQPCRGSKCSGGL